MIDKIFFSILLLVYSLITVGQNHYLITGTYTSGISKGIFVHQFNNIDGTAKEVSHIAASNPSFIAVSPDEQFIYAIEEDADKSGNGGKVSAYLFNKQKGTLSFINQQPSGGDHPCYVSVDKTGKWLAVGNYSSGSLSVFPIQTTGALENAVSKMQHRGSGINKTRQSSPHVHCTVFSADNRFLFAPDLGIDKVMIYNFDDATGQLTTAKQPYASSKDGAGPRHLCFHPSNKYAYLMEELSGTVKVFKYRSGKLKTRQIISSMPLGDSSFAGSADIHVSPDGRFLYASNRADANTIAIFSVNQKNGKLSLLGHQSTLGKTPRNFNFDPSGNFLLVANQNSDVIVVFKRDTITGLLTDTGNRIDVGNPVCLKWISIN